MRVVKQDNKPKPKTKTVSTSIEIHGASDL